MCPTGLFGGASPHSNNFPTQCSRHPLRLSARKKSKREGRGGEEKARRRRGGKKTRKWKLRRVMTLAVRPKTLSYYNVSMRVWGVCARYAPLNGRQNCPGMRCSRYALGMLRWRFGLLLVFTKWLK